MNHFTLVQSAGNCQTELVWLKLITPIFSTGHLYWSCAKYVHLAFKYNSISFRLLLSRAQGGNRDATHGKVTFHRAWKMLKYLGIVLLWLFDRKKIIGRDGARQRARSGEKESHFPLCWFSKSATSAAYFLPKHCSIEWIPQIELFLIFVAMHYQVQWCMFALIAHSSTVCLSGGSNHTGCPLWQHDEVGRETLHSPTIADNSAAGGHAFIAIARNLREVWQCEFCNMVEKSRIEFMLIVASRLLHMTKSAPEMKPRRKPGVVVPYQLPLPPLITIKHCSRFFNISSPDRENEPWLEYFQGLRGG